MANVTLIIGEDGYLVDEAARKAIGDATGLEVVDSAASENEESRLRDLRAVDASFSTPPFLEPRKTTWWRNVGFLPHSGGDASEAVKAGLEKFAAKVAASPLPENQKLVISGPKLLKTSLFAKRLASVAAVVAFAESKPWEAARAATVRAIDGAKDLGLSFAPGAADAFVAHVGTDTRSLVGELAKMRDYLGEGRSTIDLKAIDDVASPGAGVEPSLWAVTDAVGERDAAAATAAILRFDGEKGADVLATTVLEGFFRQLAELKDAVERGMQAQAAEGMNPYAAKKNLGFLRNWTLRELRVARARFMALRERAVSSQSAVMALVVCEIVRACARRGS